MRQSMPQEIEVWYLLPALRRELVRCFVKEHRLSQKEAAAILGLTPSAVSQYLRDKRAAAVRFSKKEHERIDKVAKTILRDKAQVNKLLYDLSVSFKASKTLCDAHKKHDSSVPKDCDICGLTSIT